MGKIIIAIDGYSSCGKSTLAKSLAAKLGYSFIDTGAMYRAVTLYMLENNISSEDESEIEKSLKDIEITFKYNDSRGASDTYLNGKLVENDIREMRISKNVSNYAALKKLRMSMVKQQQQMGEKGGVVLDGRDIGTVVFPHAELKIFMTASPDVRAKRRFKELESKNQTVTLEEVKENLRERDHIDSTRKESPLKQADDAKVLDNSNLSMDEQLEIALRWVDQVQE